MPTRTQRHHGELSKIDQWSSKKYIIVLVSIVCLIIIIFSVIIVAILPGPNANDIMDKYAQSLISDYNEDLGFFLKPTYGNFWFYSNSSYDVRTLISSSHGAAVWIEQANSLSFDNANTALRVEVGLFGGFVSGHPAAVEVNGGVMFFSNDFVNGATPLVDNGTLIVEDSQVNSVNYHFVILKGSNETNDWSVATAKKDSQTVFENDLVNALSSSEEIRERYAEPELDTLLEAVISRWRSALQSNGTVTYTMLQEDYDIKQIEELAKTKYGITNSSDLINSTLAYLEAIPVPPPPPTKTIFGFQVNDPDNWIYVTVWCVLLIFAYALYLPLEYLRRKSPSGNTKYYEIILTAIIIPIALILVYNHPYDYRFLSFQTATVFAALLIDFVSVYLERKRLPTQ